MPRGNSPGRRVGCLHRGCPTVTSPPCERGAHGRYRRDQGRSSARGRAQRRLVLLRRPLRRPTDRGAPVAAPGGPGTVGRRPALRPVRADRAPGGPDPGHVDRRRARRAVGGLPEPGPLDAGPRRRPATGDGVDPRRRLHGRLRRRGSLPGRWAGPRGRCGGGDRQLPTRRPRLPVPSGPGRRRRAVARWRGLDGHRQLGHRRPGRRPGVGAGPHRLLRRRPGQRHRLR